MTALTPRDAQVGSDRSGGVGLVADHSVRPGPRPARPEAVDRQVGQQRLEHRGIAGLTGSERDDQRTAPAVDELVDLGRHPAAGATQPMIGWLGAQVLVVRFSPLCGARLGPRPGSTWWRAGVRG